MVDDPPRATSTVMRLRCANTAERIDVLLGVETLRDTRKVALNWSLDFSHGTDAAYAILLWSFVYFFV